MHKKHQQYTYIYNLQFYKAPAMHAMPFLKWKMHTVPLNRIEDRRLDFILRRRMTKEHIPSPYPYTLPAWHSRRRIFLDLLTLALTGRHNTSVNSNSAQFSSSPCSIHSMSERSRDATTIVVASRIRQAVKGEHICSPLTA